MVRHIFFFIIKINDNKKYVLDRMSLFYLGLSISMILTSVFTGIKIL